MDLWPIGKGWKEERGRKKVNNKGRGCEMLCSCTKTLRGTEGCDHALKCILKNCICIPKIKEGEKVEKRN